jgi:hypothetical protein
MPDDLTPLSIVNTLTGIGAEIKAMPDVIEALDEAEIRAKSAYDYQYRKAFLTSEGAMDLRKVTAEDVAADARLEYELAGVRLRAAKEQLRVLRDRLEIGRSLGAVMRLEWSGQ